MAEKTVQVLKADIGKEKFLLYTPYSDLFKIKQVVFGILGIRSASAYKCVY